MPKPSLREPYASLCSDLMETMRGGLHEWRNDLDYPESASDMQGALMAVIRKYDVKLRPVVLDRKEIYQPDPVCPVCGETLDSDPNLATLHGPKPTSDFYAHQKCINRKSR